jgi:hypothetical protein
MPVNKPGGPNPRKSTTANRSHQSVSLQGLLPTGWAPGPVGDGTPFKLPPLKITLPEVYTAPLVLKHYEAMRNQLRQRVRAGGQDGVTVIINGRLTAQEPGRAKPTIIEVSVL